MKGSAVDGGPEPASAESASVSTRASRTRTIPSRCARTRIKVCGLTRVEDALLAAGLGVDAVGFVFAPASVRRVDPETVAHIVRVLPPFVTAVGVFQDQPVDEVRSVVRACGLHMAQLHGDEDADYIREVGVPVLKALRVEGKDDLAVIERYPGSSAFLLDSGRGGTGRTFDWEWAAEAGRSVRVVLAGGLTPDNVAAAVRRARPWAVDAASGTESEPGVKDHVKLAGFVSNVKGTEIG